MDTLSIEFVYEFTDSNAVERLLFTVDKLLAMLRKPFDAKYAVASSVAELTLLPVDRCLCVFSRRLVVFCRAVRFARADEVREISPIAIVELLSEVYRRILLRV